MSIAHRWGWKGWLTYAGLWTFLALFFASQSLSQTMLYPREPNPYRVPAMLLQSFVNWYTWGVLTLGLMWLMRRIPFSRERLGSWLGLYALVGVVCVLIRVGVNWACSLVTPLFGPSPFWERLLLQAHWLLFIYAAILGAIVAVDYYWKYREREVRAAQLETKLARTQLQVLRMQLQPHFLFNTLHGISTLMHRDVEAADTMLTQLSELLRIAMTNDGEQETSLKRELDFLERYVEIQQTRFGDRLRVDMAVDPEVLDALVPTLVLQPLVENAIIHGVGKRADGGHVEVIARRRNGTLALEVRDDGAGLPGGVVPRNGLGLSNTRARLEQLYGDSHRMELSRAPAGGLAVCLTIPFRTAPEHRAESPRSTS